MPSQKKKAKKNKPEVQPLVVPVPIKAEPLDIKPLSAYIDERVELIRQAFSCLKPKEVKALAPDFMQGKSIEFIQEHCLDEVLGISTKRLLSIIDSTKCPTDTESSDEDVEQSAEHISLDEISSDSEVEVKPPVKTVKLKDKKSKKTQEKAVSKSTENSDKNGNKKNEKEMTVLEILELQARARAIRSQLALEPVTKIELDSDQENGSEAEPVPVKALKLNKEKPNDNEEASSSKSNRSSPPKAQSKRVRLKRNFRIRQVGDEESNEETVQATTQTELENRETRNVSHEKQVDHKEAKSSESPVKQSIEALNCKSRDSSPEVIPVIASPETLCISSDSEEEKEKRKRSSIFVDNIEELVKKSELDLQTQTETNKTGQSVSEEPEEGEISDEQISHDTIMAISPLKNNQSELSNEVDKSKEIVQPEQEEELDYEIKEVSDSETESSTHCNTSTKTDTGNHSKTNDVVELLASANESSDSSESASSESDENNKNATSDEDDNDPDVVEIHDSSDETLLEQKLAEDEPEKSWNSRWLESNRVAKVMAASRLGNKVRDKLKRNKKKRQEEQKETAKPPSPIPTVEPASVSTAVVGSVEHYNELVSIKSTEHVSLSDKATDEGKINSEKSTTQ
ncbi:dentin sialophosphoprotein [Malaya genurostris]|uniref:dentin sialophosphoprotein n=1 Tax=Malaya genurostris TaxID=325434 RepID=UPI0026F3E6BA|nr:dentin sialophosphoprotein [Malaya genurostris]